jgi:hypothetical protein
MLHDAGARLSCGEDERRYVLGYLRTFHRRNAENMPVTVHKIKL